MAEKLSVIIALEGAKEIERQLEGVGEAGEAAFNKITAAAKEVGGFNKLDPSVVTKTIEDLGVKGEGSIDKITQAVKSAGRMETLVDGVAAVEKGFAAAGNAVEGMRKALGFLLPSARTVARLLVAAFGAATVGAIASTTKEILELDAAAIKVGSSIEDLAKARAIFEGLGISSKEAVAVVDENMVAKVKEAVAQTEKFGIGIKNGVDNLKILEEASKRTDATGDLARKTLEKFGRLDLSDAAKEIDKIWESTARLPDKILATIAILEKMPATAERTRIAATRLGTEFAQALNAGGVEAEKAKQKLLEVPAATQQAANAAAKLAQEWNKLKTLIASPFTVSPAALETIAGIMRAINEQLNRFSTAQFRDQAQADLAAVGQFFANLQQNAQADLQAVLQFFAQMPGQIAGFFAGFGSNLWDGIVAGARAAWDMIISFIDKAIARVRQFLGMGGGGAVGEGAGFARGGVMGGRGTGTSDSNLAWLSRGEYVVPARAVRQPGVLQLLEALRRSGGNLQSVLDRMGHFALGGMVGAPAFAAGGVNGMSHVTIAFPGLPPISGLRASSAVVDELHRAAALAQVRSGGRKPSRYS